jgi:hypothetical protein
MCADKNLLSAAIFKWTYLIPKETNLIWSRRTTNYSFSEHEWSGILHKRGTCDIKLILFLNSLISLIFKFIYMGWESYSRKLKRTFSVFPIIVQSHWLRAATEYPTGIVDSFHFKDIFYLFTDCDSHKLLASYRHHIDELHEYMCEFRPLPKRKRDMRSSVMSRSVQW